MLGILLSDKELKEMFYLLRKEMDEMLLDLREGRLDSAIKEAIRERYQIIFRMYARLASPEEISKYVIGRNIR